MTDKEMWLRIEAACARLDRIREGVQRGVRKVLLPAALGTGLALGTGACGGERTVQVDGGSGSDAVKLPPSPSVYSAPFPGPRPDAAEADMIEPPPQMDYAAPFPPPNAADLGADVVPPLAPAYAAPYPMDAGVGDAGIADGAVDGPLNAGLYGTPFP